MTGKDFIKILLCSYGYDRNIKVETYNGDFGAPGYEVEADHENGDHFQCIDKEHKPCPTCQDNDHAIEFDDGAHYHCNGSYYMNCKKLLQWYEDCRKHREEFRKENGIK